MKTVVLDDELMRMRNDLEKEGYKVVDSSMIGQADAIIVAGMENNFMNMQDISTTKKVIEAKGKDVNEIINELRGMHR